MPGDQSRLTVHTMTTSLILDGRAIERVLQ
jgi:hypothetical protein